ncbi:sporulation integral membrane protein YlbJ [Paenibacillus sp. 1_12]|uniref:nucleoside recognition domain-containing protein n=1 Tax=Paenibacillus sp. 1_12 TaxID=1566278 RepID=UPI0008EF2803|nr:nucleoside recognition domain-containing protein [Paenibacillus sp. 1_12]SFL47291.1 sporulation integral membrane protein YlbJ [Paenibacillus sp. 1_12]
MFTAKRLTTLLLGCLALLLVLCMIVFPDRIFQASLQGLSIWWKLVFPALLPFLIITEILRGLGFLHAIGTLLEPLLRYLFRLPGAGGWPLSIGLTAGAPSAAIAIGELRQNKLVTRGEAERLLSLSHVASPMMLITVIGVGFLNNAKIGMALALLHYGAVMIMGLLERFKSPHAVEEESAIASNRLSNGSSALSASSTFHKSITALRSAHDNDGRTFGKLLGDSVAHSIQQLMVIGGVMIIFSVLSQVIAISSITDYVAMALSNIEWLRLPETKMLLNAIMSGVFEIHLGAFAMGQNNLLSDNWQYAILSAILGWGGLSAHAQVKSFTLSTDIRYSVFLRSRLLHAIISFVLTAVLWNSLNQWLSGLASPVFLSHPLLHSGQTGARATVGGQAFDVWILMSPIMMWLGIVMLLLLLFSVIIAFFAQSFGRSAPNSKR